jgi:hypothetical protein
LSFAAESSASGPQSGKAPYHSLPLPLLFYLYVIAFVTDKFNTVFLDSLGGEHSASGGENLRLSGLHEVAGKQTGFIPIRE